MTLETDTGTKRLSGPWTEQSRIPGGQGEEEETEEEREREREEGGFREEKEREGCREEKEESIRRV